ncbi:S-layer homology domain-containing protein [Cohnella mopanensis]|uniref:S-layer homology domain-containing protein n=1 Tax=Cohnella mopanensis TaxID=2911966 RepID=UPI001EF7F324|nr:S-layer homology domain-containing protein [Cohnella mopanensis]
MKKSLSLLLSAALVFGSFGSLASAADALTTAQKYQALKDKGILKGTTTGDDGLSDKLNRAQFATIAIALAGLSEEKTGKTFTDVTAKQWWYGAIEAAAKAGLVEGSNGKFDPKGDVTVEQVIVIASRILKLEEVKDAKVEGASTWAAGYIQAAIDSGLISARTDYKAAATRGQAIEVGYQAYITANPVAPEKASVASAKATGVKKVSVTLDKAVDTAKAKLSLKKGTIDVATTTKWSDDKKSATLELTDVVVGEGEYTVTLSGLEATEIGTASAKFTAEKERVTKIEFVNTNEYLARSTNNIVKIKASNQYDENAAANPGSYTVYAGNNNDVYVKLGKDAITGELLLTLNTKLLTSGGQDVYQGNSIIAVNIFNNDTHITASKNYKMGTDPFVSKMDISPVKYSNGKDFLGGKGENAVISVNQFDQYGNIIAYSSKDDTDIRFQLNGYEPDLKATVGDSNNDDIADVKIALAQNVDKTQKYTFNIFNQAGTATGELSLQSAKTANKIEFGDVSNQVAAGDTSAYVPVTAYDAAGNQLSVDDLVNAQNAGRIKFQVSGLENVPTGVDGYSFVTYGENKGKLKIDYIPSKPRTTIVATAIIATSNASSVASKQIQIGDARVPTTLKVIDEAKQKTVALGVSEFKFAVYDQYGKQLDKIFNLDQQGNVVTTAPAAGNGITTYKVSVTTSTYSTAIAIKDRDAGFPVGATADYANSAQLESYNKGFKFDASAALSANDSAAFTAQIIKIKGDSVVNTTEIAKVTRKIEATNDTLNYTVSAVSDLFNAQDSKNVKDAALPASVQKEVTTSAFAREISLSATDAAGNTVAIPNTITQASSNNPVVAVATAVTGGKAKVLGNNKGTTTIAVSYTTSKGLQERKTITVNTKDDLITAAKISAGKSAPSIDNLDNAFEAMEIKVTDNYGVAYEKATAASYNYLFGVTFSVSNVKLASGAEGGTVTVDQNGVITVGGNAKYFELTAYTADGSASSYVTVK